MTRIWKGTFDLFTKYFAFIWERFIRCYCSNQNRRQSLKSREWFVAYWNQCQNCCEAKKDRNLRPSFSAERPLGARRKQAS